MSRLKFPRVRKSTDDTQAEAPRPLYLVSTAGHPNFGDELITRAWLDFLAQRRPDVDVWLDCPHPGRASHLFAGAHPRLRTTNTLWELALGSESHDPVTDMDRIRRLVVDLGSPRFDSGLLLLRTVGSIHLLGGGYLNSMWHDNLGIVAATAEVSRRFAVPVFATGQGFLPLDEAHAPWLKQELATFRYVEARDAAGSTTLGVTAGDDDAFLALALDDRRPVYDETGAPDRMVLVQGDLKAWEDEAVENTIRSFVAGAGPDGVGVVEAVPPDDARYRDAVGQSRFYPFGHIWHGGLPARAGQRWLTTRFHMHLLAAARGAAGIVIAGKPGYYDVKHESLLALGTGWTVVEAGADAAAERASVAADFPAKAAGMARRKLDLARRLYGL